MVTMQQILVDHRGSPEERTTWRTYAVLAHTLSGSARIVARAGLGRLTQSHVDRTVKRWCGHTFRLSRTTVVATGREHVVPGQVYVLLSNHQSLLDIPAALVAFPGRLRFVAKEELRYVPVFGQALQKAGVLFVDRKDRARAISSLQGARQLAAEGTSLWIAAEGTRSDDGRLGPLKKGGFHVALDLQVPILPTWIEGTLEVIPPRQWASVTGRTVAVRFGPPIPTEGLGRGDLDVLLDRTRQALLSLQASTQSATSSEKCQP
jgi:1-acyl-sn-glycerol-3-phosphate acyltransferase